MAYPITATWRDVAQDHLAEQTAYTAMASQNQSTEAQRISNEIEREKQASSIQVETAEAALESTKAATAINKLNAKAKQKLMDKDLLVKQAESNIAVQQSAIDTQKQALQESKFAFGIKQNMQKSNPKLFEDAATAELVSNIASNEVTTQGANSQSAYNALTALIDQIRTGNATDDSVIAVVTAINKTNSDAQDIDPSDVVALSKEDPESFINMVGVYHSTFKASWETKQEMLKEQAKGVTGGTAPNIDTFVMTNSAGQPVPGKIARANTKTGNFEYSTDGGVTYSETPPEGLTVSQIPTATVTTESETPASTVASRIKKVQEYGQAINSGIDFLQTAGNANLRTDSVLSAYKTIRATTGAVSDMVSSMLGGEASSLLEQSMMKAQQNAPLEAADAARLQLYTFVLDLAKAKTSGPRGTLSQGVFNQLQGEFDMDRLMSNPDLIYNKVQQATRRLIAEQADIYEIQQGESALFMPTSEQLTALSIDPSTYAIPSEQGEALLRSGDIQGINNLPTVMHDGVESVMIDRGNGVTIYAPKQSLLDEAKKILGAN